MDFHQFLTSFVTGTMLYTLPVMLLAIIFVAQAGHSNRERMPCWP